MMMVRRIRSASGTVVRVDTIDASSARACPADTPRASRPTILKGRCDAAAVCRGGKAASGRQICEDLLLKGNRNVFMPLSSCSAQSRVVLRSSGIRIGDVMTIGSIKQRLSPPPISQAHVGHSSRIGYWGERDYSPLTPIWLPTSGEMRRRRATVAIRLQSRFDWRLTGVRFLLGSPSLASLRWLARNGSDTRHGLRPCQRARFLALLDSDSNDRRLFAQSLSSRARTLLGPETAIEQITIGASRRTRTRTLVERQTNASCRRIPASSRTFARDRYGQKTTATQRLRRRRNATPLRERRRQGRGVDRSAAKSWIGTEPRADSRRSARTRPQESPARASRR